MTEHTKARIALFFKKAVQLIFNPRFLLCFGIGWFITNGWSYAMLGIGTYFSIGWMVAVSTGYLALLWIPFTPEKLITTAIAIALLQLLFPKDEKTLGQLKTLHAAAKAKWHAFLKKRKHARSLRSKRP